MPVAANGKQRGKHDLIRGRMLLLIPNVPMQGLHRILNVASDGNALDPSGTMKEQQYQRRE